MDIKTPEGVGAQVTIYWELDGCISSMSIRELRLEVGELSRCARCQDQVVTYVHFGVIEITVGPLGVLRSV